MKITIIGTGHVGLITAVCFAKTGHKVICIDNNQKTINSLRKKEITFHEAELDSLLIESYKFLEFTTDYTKCNKSEIIFLCLPTPNDKKGNTNLSYIKNCCLKLNEIIKKDTTIVIKSTVPVGTCDEMEKIFSKNIYKIHVADNPEFLKQGTAIFDTLYAPRIVVGVNDETSRKKLKQVYQPFINKPYNSKYIEMSRTSAEMVKYAANTFLALNISYINSITDLCEKKDVDITEVFKGLSDEPRISNYFLNTSVGFGGSCLSKDAKSLFYQSNKKLKLLNETIKINENRKLKFAKQINKNHNDKKIAILGVSFKEGTDDIRNSVALDNINYLLKKGYKIDVYDPKALNNLKKIYNNQLNYFNSIDKCIKNNNIILILTKWKEIVNLNFDLIEKNTYIYDSKNCFDLNISEKYNINYIPNGRKKQLLK